MAVEHTPQARATDFMNRGAVIETARRAVRICSLAAIPAGLIANILLPRLVASIYGLAPAIMVDTIYIQTVCPLVKGQLHLFWRTLGFLAAQVRLRPLGNRV